MFLGTNLSTTKTCHFGPSSRQKDVYPKRRLPSSWSSRSIDFGRESSAPIFGLHKAHTDPPKKQPKAHQGVVFIEGVSNPRHHLAPRGAVAHDPRQAPPLRAIGLGAVDGVGRMELRLERKAVGALTRLLPNLRGTSTSWVTELESFQPLPFAKKGGSPDRPQEGHLHGHPDNPIVGEIFAMNNSSKGLESPSGIDLDPTDSIPDPASDSESEGLPWEWGSAPHGSKRVHSWGQTSTA